MSTFGPPSHEVFSFSLLAPPSSIGQPALQPTPKLTNDGYTYNATAFITSSAPSTALPPPVSTLKATAETGPERFVDRLVQQTRHSIWVPWWIAVVELGRCWFIRRRTARDPAHLLQSNLRMLVIL